jgi:hypothetical protein
MGMAMREDATMSVSSLTGLSPCTSSLLMMTVSSLTPPLSSKSGTSYPSEAGS